MKAVISYWKYDSHCKDTKKALAEIDASEIRRYLLKIRKLNSAREFLKRGMRWLSSWSFPLVLSDLDCSPRFPPAILGNANVP